MKNTPLFLLAFAGVFFFTASCANLSTSSSMFQPKVETLQAQIDTEACGISFRASVANTTGYQPISLLFEIADESGKIIKQGPIDVTNDGTYSLIPSFSLPKNSSYSYRAVIEYTSRSNMGQLIQFTTPQCDCYPTTYRALTQSESLDLLKEFNSMNPGTNVTIDKYGFIGAVSVPVNYQPSSVVSNEEQALQMAENRLRSNSKFSGVTPESQLEVGRILQLNSNGPWRINYKQQYYKGLRIADRNPSYAIEVWVDSSVSGIEGHYFPYVYIPDYEKTSLQAAKDSLIGRVLTYWNIAGQPMQFTISQESLSSTQQVKAIVPQDTQNGLRMLVCWEIPIGMFPAWPSDRGSWTAYIDTITGEVVRIDQNFQT
jgi:hypothetical protein